MPRIEYARRNQTEEIFHPPAEKRRDIRKDQQRRKPHSENCFRPLRPACRSPCLALCHAFCALFCFTLRALLHTSCALFRPARRAGSFRYSFPVLCPSGGQFLPLRSAFYPAPAHVFRCCRRCSLFRAATFRQFRLRPELHPPFLFLRLPPAFRLSRCTHVSSRRPPLRQKAGGAGRHGISIRKKDGNYKSGLQSTGLFPRIDKCGRFLPARFALPSGKSFRSRRQTAAGPALPSAAIPFPSPRGSGNPAFDAFFRRIFQKISFTASLPRCSDVTEGDVAGESPLQFIRS